MKTHPQLLGAGSIVLSTIIYGFFSILARIVGFELPIFFQNWTREIVAVVIIFFLIYVNHSKLKRMSTKDFLWVWLRALAGSAAFLLYFYCINAMPIGTTYFIFYGGSSIFGYILGKLLFNEHLTPTKWIAIVTALLGLMLIYSISFRTMPLLYIFMAFGAGAATSFWNVSPKKIQTYPSIQLVLLDNLLPIPLYIILSLLAHESWTMPRLTPVWIASLSYGVLFVMTGQLVVYGFKRLEAQIGSILMLGEIPMAILFGVIFYKEFVTPFTVIGGILIITAMVIPELNLNGTHQKMH